MLRRPLVVGVGLLALVLLVAVPAWWQGHDEDAVPPTRTTSTHAVGQPKHAEAVAALAAFARAVETRSGGATPLLRTLVANAAELDVVDLSLRYIDETGEVAPDGSWTGEVDLTYRFDGYDADDVHEQIEAAFGADGQVTGFRGPLWLSGPVEVRRSVDTLVLAAGPAALADRFATWARRAVAVVGRVVTGWRGPLVVEVPRDGAGLDALLGRPAGTDGEVAAITAALGGGPTHVLANPDVVDGLTSRGAQVVISHEATHVATRAVGDGAGNGHRPTWLTEGFADYVALRDVPLPLSVTAGQILAQVRTRGAPDHLPGPAEFDSGSDSFGAEYEAAWLACRLLARLGGQGRLVQLYDRAGTGEDVDSAMRDLFGFGLDGLTRRWSATLRDAARKDLP